MEEQRRSKNRQICHKDCLSYLQRRPLIVANVIGCYHTQSELARHDSRAHVQQLTIFSTTLACFAHRATHDVDITDCT